MLALGVGGAGLIFKETVDAVLAAIGATIGLLRRLGLTHLRRVGRVRAHVGCGLLVGAVHLGLVTATVVGQVGVYPVLAIGVAILAVVRTIGIRAVGDADTGVGIDGRAASGAATPGGGDDQQSQESKQASNGQLHVGIVKPIHKTRGLSRGRGCGRMEVGL